MKIQQENECESVTAAEFLFCLDTVMSGGWCGTAKGSPCEAQHKAKTWKETDSLVTSWQLGQSVEFGMNVDIFPLLFKSV